MELKKNEVKLMFSAHNRLADAEEYYEITETL
jgi:hypothetical protein